MTDYIFMIIDHYETSDSLIKLVIIDFAIQWIGFALAYSFQSEKCYDLFGSCSFLLLAFLNWKWHNRGHPRQEIQTFCIFIWALRLGLYLFTRILKTGQDRRFDKIKKSAVHFFIVWTMQGVWVFVTLLPSLLALKSSRQRDLCSRDYIGWSLWFLGFLIESIADYQKSSFRNDPANKGWCASALQIGIRGIPERCWSRDKGGYSPRPNSSKFIKLDKFIHTGLWALSRHPNYLGEILLWFGLYISASSVFTSLQYLTVFCPVFDYLLIAKISGIPLLEEYALKKWGKLPQYQDYLKKTPPLVPFLY